MASREYLHEKEWVRFLAGGLGAISGEWCTLPLDNVKVRMQNNGLDGRPKLYASTPDCFKQVYRLNALSTFWRGTVAGLTRQVVYQGPKMLCFDPLRIGIAHILGKSDSNGTIDFLAGGMIGGFFNFVANPTDVIKVNRQLNGVFESGLPMKTNFETIKMLVHVGGVKSLWKGSVPNVSRAFTVNAAELATYTRSKLLVEKHLNINRRSKLNQFISSFFAGLAGALACNPFDTAKTRIMKSRDPSGMFKVMGRIIMREGPLALYKGFAMNWARIGVWNIMFFNIFEEVRLDVNLLHSKRGIRPHYDEEWRDAWWHKKG